VLEIAAGFFSDEMSRLGALKCLSVEALQTQSAVLVPLLDSANRDVCCEALKSMVWLEDVSKHMAPVLALMTHSDAQVRLALIETVSRLDYSYAIKACETVATLLTDESEASTNQRSDSSEG